MNKSFLNHINKYHPIQWLVKSVELSRRESDNSNVDLVSHPAFLIIMSDIAVRISQNNMLLNKLPSDKEYEDFISLYINTQSFTQHKLIKDFGILGLCLILTEQVKFSYENINMVGRLSLLYSQYEDEIFKFTGLSTTHIITILVALMAYYQKPEHYVFEIENIHIENVDGLTIANLISFLEYFSYDVKSYRKELKKLGIDKNQLYSFRLVEKKPIIRFNESEYIIPSVDNLLYSLTSNMNIHLLSYFSDKGNGKKYHDLFGYKFEDYVRLLTVEVFSNNIIEASDIVPKETENAEFVIFSDETAIVVEVKKYNFLRDTAFKKDIDDLDVLLKRHIVKAYRQIETTFKFVKQKNKIGIIVVLGEFYVQALILDYLRNNCAGQGVEYLDNIVIMSIGAYESLLANTSEDIIRILNNYLSTDEKERGDILMTIHHHKKETINPLLKKAFDDELEKIFKS